MRKMIIHHETNNKCGLWARHEVKMAGCWPSFFGMFIRGFKLYDLFYGFIVDTVDI